MSTQILCNESKMKNFRTKNRPSAGFFVLESSTLVDSLLDVIALSGYDKKGRKKSNDPGGLGNHGCQGV